MRALLSVMVVLSTIALAQTRDGGTVKKAELSAGECDKLMDVIVLLSVDESLADDPEVKKMSPKEREITTKLARREALADPQLVELKKSCPERYDKKTEQCISKAKSMKDVDACSK